MMYFEVENTPEHIRRQRRMKKDVRPVVEEECPVLTLAPFTKAPIVLFEDVPVGQTAERTLNVFNPGKKTLELSIARDLPAGLSLEESCIVIEPSQSYILTLTWTPIKSTAQRDNITFVTSQRSRHDVVIVMKTSVVSTKQQKSKSSLRKTPTKKIGILATTIKSKRKTPPKLPVKKQFEKQTYRNIFASAATPVNRRGNIHKINNVDKENISPGNNTIDINKCPFDSFMSIPDCSQSINLGIVDTTDLFPETQAFMHNLKVPEHCGILSPNKSYNLDKTNIDIFDNIKFTPLKSFDNIKRDTYCKKNPFNDTLDFSPAIDLTKEDINFTNMFDKPLISDTFDKNSTRIRDVSPSDFRFKEKQTIKKSPIKFNGLDISINDFTVDLTFNPDRFSTERKLLSQRDVFNNATIDLSIDKTYSQLSSETYTKPDSPIIPLDPDSHNLQSSPYSEEPVEYKKPVTVVQTNRRKLNFTEAQTRAVRGYRDRNNDNGVRSIIEADLWQKSPPRSLPLYSVPEETTQMSESTQCLDRTENRQITFTINQTFEKKEKLSLPSNNTWTKKSLKSDSDVWKIPLTNKKAKDLKGIPETDRTFNKTNVFLESDVYSQAATVDPFLSESYFYDEKCVDRFEKEFKAWLNYILTPPADFDTGEHVVDLGKAFIENRNKELPAAPTKEQVSSNYHNNHRLESLRKSATNLLNSVEIKNVYTKLSAQIDKRVISIRQDKNLHLNIGLQKVIMDLLLCYNPLWLRIGLEAIYNTIIPLQSNHDIYGLSTFIIQRMFKDPYIKNKHSHPTVPNLLLPSYTDFMNRFTLKKFFLLVYFLDQAKQKKLIFHDPCLFCRNASCKDSREILIRFTRELIAGIGDITKHLRLLGLVVTHKQSYLDEFKFGVQNIAVDLKDGVRLTKVMEIILVKNGLTLGLRTPAISRLQKIHNVQIALNALKNSNFVINGDITAKDIVEGHREKTLSLLWQIIHVFKAPLFSKAAIVIQAWWKKKYLKVIIDKRIEYRKEMKRQGAARVIQHWWRNILLERLMKKKATEIYSATICIQKYVRMWIARGNYKRIKASVLKIEQWYISAKQIKQAEEILRYLIKRQKCVSSIQAWYRRQLKSREILQIKHLYVEYCNETKLKINSVNIIKHFIKRCIILHKFKAIVVEALNLERVRKHIELINKSATIIQSVFKMYLARKIYCELRCNVIKIQSLVRCYILSRDFKHFKTSVQYIQVKYRSKLLMIKQRNKYIEMKQSAIKIQSIIRMYRQRVIYRQIKKAALNLQRYHRGNQARKQYKQMQILYNTCITIQRLFRAKLSMRKCYNEYIKLKCAAFIIQNRYRALITMRSARQQYENIKRASIIIQTWYRANRLRDLERDRFLKLKHACISLQQYYRAYRIKEMCKSNYLVLKSSTILLQRHYKAILAGRKARNYFVNLKNATLTLQRRYRAQRIMRTNKLEYQKLKSSAIYIQRNYRAKLEMRKCRVCYCKLKNATILLQQRYRAKLMRRKCESEYVHLRTATILLQRKLRALISMRICRKEYLRMKNSAILLQKHYRANKLRDMCVDEYRRLKNAAIVLQIRFRAKKLMEHDRLTYLEIKCACIVIQQRYRAIVKMRSARRYYNNLRKSVINIQNRFRANLRMKQNRNDYLKQKLAVDTIKQWHRNVKLTKKCRQDYVRTVKAVYTIQSIVRAHLAMKKAKVSYMRLKNASVVLQMRYRALKSMQRCRDDYINIRNKTVLIQKWYCAILLGRTIRNEFLQYKKSTIIVQRRYRALISMRKCHYEYQKLRNATLIVQRSYRAKLEMVKCRSSFQTLKKSVIVMQSQIRMMRARTMFVKQRLSALKIQMYYRAYKQMIYEKMNYLDIRNKIIKTQSYIRMYIKRSKYQKLKNAVSFVENMYKAKLKLRELKQLEKLKQNAATLIQKNIKMYQARKYYMKVLQAVVIIQHRWRGLMKARCYNKEFIELRASIVKLQAYSRGYLTRKRVIHLRREARERREREKFEEAALKIQAIWRGYIVRKKCCEQANALRKRWGTKGPQSTSQTLAEQSEDAIFVLTHFSDMASIIRAFDSLKLLTEVYPMIYNNNSQLISSRLIIYMWSGNRSIASLEVMRLGVASLVNLTRYKHTAIHSYQRDDMATFMKLWLRWCDKDTQLFCSMCTYIWLFSKYHHIHKDLSDFLNDNENRKIMNRIRSLVLRKKRMEDNSKKHKSCRGLDTEYSYSTCLNTSLNSVVAKTNQMPASEPDFGLGRIDKCRYFNNDVFAIETVFSVYRITQIG